MKKTLSLHKNTIEKKRKRDIADAIIKGGSKMCRDRDIRAYALVAIDSKGTIHAIWDTGSIVPMWAFPATISAGLMRDMEEVNIEETWVPPVLPIKG